MYFAALLSRFTTTCSSREASAYSQIGCGGNDTVSSCLRWSINGRTVSTAHSTMPLTATRSRSKLNPAGRDAGHFQQVIDQMGQLPHLTLDDGAGLSAGVGFSSFRRRSRCTALEMGASGLRSSWD